ncbi:MAG: hypothetical protein K2X94_04345 [Amoebophilaceae bacterium]|nr:hypothetical protein [Amoebophilaceae bacterium]
MPLSEDKSAHPNQLVIAHFEALLASLLEDHKGYQQKIEALLEENKALKEGLGNLDLSIDKKKLLKANKEGTLVAQINALIKEIDSCLAYFEKT